MKKARLINGRIEWSDAEGKNKGWAETNAETQVDLPEGVTVKVIRGKLILDDKEYSEGEEVKV